MKQINQIELYVSDNVNKIEAICCRELSFVHIFLSCFRTKCQNFKGS
jgi:hypothetical protein